MNLSSMQNIVKVGVLALLLVAVLLGTIIAGKTVAGRYFAKASACPSKNVSALQVTANSAVVAWETEDTTQGRVEYGTNSTSLAFSAPEASSGKSHNVPLTLLTPNTVYYYVVTIGDTRCDSSGVSCSDASCIPWSFTTAPVNPGNNIVAPITSPAASPSGNQKNMGEGSLSAFCLDVRKNIGSSSKDAAKWVSLKQYDIDGNGIVNGLDVMKCAASGK